MYARRVGSSVYAVFEEPIREAHEVDGKMLSRQVDALDEAATKQGVQPLTAFISVSPAMREFAIEEGVDPEAIPPEAWFEAEQGLMTVRALRAGDPDLDLDADLAALERALIVAKERGIRFHVVVDV